ncbi:MAG: hypothetical protein FWE61_04360 [Micrococcales bacterium]|nr:hypothetical protein [Micrococcales bacterium]
MRMPRSIVLAAAAGLVLGLAGCTSDGSAPDERSTGVDFENKTEETTVPLPSWVDATGPLVMKTYYHEELDIHFDYPATADLVMKCKPSRSYGLCTYVTPEGTEYYDENITLIFDVYPQPSFPPPCSTDYITWEILAHVPGFQGYDNEGTPREVVVAQPVGWEREVGVNLMTAGPDGTVMCYATFLPPETSEPTLFSARLLVLPNAHPTAADREWATAVISSLASGKP